MTFESDTEARKCVDRPTVSRDQNFLAWLSSGIPACAGVAIGLDRLLMGILGVDSIDQVLAFSWVRC